MLLKHPIFTIAVILTASLGFVLGVRLRQAELSEPQFTSFKHAQLPPRASPRNDFARGEVSAESDSMKLSIKVLASIDKLHYQDAERFLKKIAHTDPIAALDLVRSLPPWARSRAATVVLAEWMVLNPAAAWQWASDNYKGFFETREFASAVITSGRYDLAISAVNRTTSIADRREVAGHVFRAWAENDLPSFVAWSATLDGEAKGIASLEIGVRMLANNDPSALNWLQHQLWNAPSASMIWEQLTHRLVEQRGFDEAAKVFASLEPSPVLWSAYGAMARQASSEVALGWLERIPSSQARDLYVTAVIGRYVSSDLPFAFKAVEMIVTPALRENQLKQLLPALAAKDPAQAASYLESTNLLSAEAKARIRKAIATPIPST